MQNIFPLNAFARLIEQDDWLVFGETAHKRQHLFLSPRERTGVLREPTFEDRKTIEIATEGPDLAACAHEGEIVANGQIVENRALLRAICHAATPARGRIELRTRLTIEKHLSAAPG